MINLGLLFMFVYLDVVRGFENHVIFKNFQSILKASLVNHCWYDLASSDEIWRPLCYNMSHSLEAVESNISQETGRLFIYVGI